MQEITKHGYAVIRSGRKTMAIEVKRQSTEVMVRVPYMVPISKINMFVDSHLEWIEKTIERLKEKNEKELLEVEKYNIDELKAQAKAYIPVKVKYYSLIMGLVPTAIKITEAKTRYGSCSPKNSLCFSCFLMLKDNRFIDYVIVHELAHIKHHNHGKMFYALIAKYLPDYKDRIMLSK